MRDSDVRAALHVRLQAEHGHELARTRFVDELSLCGEVRVDVAVMNGELAGYELKSERDTLRRLPRQIEIYSRVLDRATLVVAACHVDHAAGSLPDWWGLVVARSERGVLGLERVRAAERNERIDADALVQLLWRDEVLDELTIRGLDHRVRSGNRRRMWARLTESVPLDELRHVVRERLKRRVGWRAQPSPP
jgi:hypothetical protein